MVADLEEPFCQNKILACQNLLAPFPREGKVGNLGEPRHDSPLVTNNKVTKQRKQKKQLEKLSSYLRGHSNFQLEIIVRVL